MKKFIKFASLALAAAMVVPLAACNSSNKMLKDDTKLVMATNAQFEPFEYMENNKITGIDVDIATAIAGDMGVKLEISNMNFDSIITSVSTGKADCGVAGITKTADREKSVDFSDAYFDAGQAIIVKNDNTTINSKDDLKGKKIAVQKGTTGDDEAVKITGEKNITRFNASTDAVTELKNGKADAVIIDNFTAKSFLKKNTDIKQVGDPITNEKYCIAIRKGNTALVNKINASLKKLKDSGKLDEIINKYQ